MKIFVLIKLSLLILFFQACSNPNSDKSNTTGPDSSLEETAVLISIPENTGVSENCSINKLADSAYEIVFPAKEAWVDFNINIEKAGRYTFELIAIAKDSNAVVWMEDYVGNKDDRTYNVTGGLAISSGDDLKRYSIDGSPLNQGLHKMRLHISGGDIRVGEMKFSLLKPHVQTPEIITQKMDGDSLIIVWSDEFEEGTTPDTSKWTFDVGNWGWGNNELQYYTENRAENARIEDGNLIIEARKNDMGQKWTSARLTTRGKTAFIYGRIEFRAMVPPNKGNWAAGWTLGDSYVDELSWPYCGEIDILESVGYEMDNETGNGVAHASAHCGAYYFKLENQPTGIIKVNNMHEAFHTYAVDWSPEGIIAYVDDIEYFRYEDTSNELTWPFNKAQNIILNLAMGGGWGGLQGMDDTVDSQIMVIDYVRVYAKE